MQQFSKSLLILRVGCFAALARRSSSACLDRAIAKLYGFFSDRKSSSSGLYTGKYSCGLMAQVAFPFPHLAHLLLPPLPTPAPQNQEATEAAATDARSHNDIIGEEEEEQKEEEEGLE